MNTNFLNLLKKAGLLILISLCLSLTTWAQTVTVNDTGLRTYLLTLVDAANGGNGDSQIQVTEAEAYTDDITYQFNSLSDPTGLEAFVNITELRLYGNELDAIDLTPYSLVEIINLAANDLETVDLSGNSALIEIFLEDNPLIEIDLSNNTLLEDFNVSDTNLTSLDVSELTNLLSFSQENLTGITELDLSQNTLLEYVWVDNFAVYALDLSSNSLLTDVHILNNVNLNKLNIANGANALIENLDISGNANALSCITVDDVTAANGYEDWSKDEGISYSLDCTPPEVQSFSPINGATDVSRDIGTLTMTMSEPVAAGEGTFRLLRKTFNTEIAVFTMGTSDVTVDGTTVTLNNVPQLSVESSYFIQNANSGANALQDAAGNPLVDWNTDETWSFSMASGADIVSRSPVPSATNVNPNTSFQITFDEDIQFMEGNPQVLVIKRNGAVWLAPMADDANLSIDGNTLTYDPGVNLLNSTEYSVQLKSALENLSGYPIKSFFESEWTFTTGILDEVSPFVSLFSPLDGATDVSIDEDLVITFNENVELGTGEINLFDGGNQLIETYSTTLNTSQLIFDNDQLTINPTADLEANKDYYLIIDSEAIIDVSENAFAGTVDKTTWNFKTVQMGQAPTDIHLSADHFDESIGSSQVIATLSATDPDDNTNYYELVYVEEYGTAYEDFYITGTTLYSGSNGYEYTDKSEYSLRIKAKDDHNNEYIKDITIYINDNEPPVVSSQNPLDNATDVSRTDDLVLTFDEEIVLGSGTISLKYVGSDNQTFESYTIPSATEVTVSGNELTINPSDDFPPLADIFVTISTDAIEDILGNSFAGFTDEATWNFTTIDDVAPAFPNLSPSHESTYGWLCSCINLGFNESLQEGSGTVSLYESDGTLVETITTGIGDSRVSFPATFRIAFDFDAEYDELQVYYVTVSDGAILDLAGNAFAGIAAEEWSYTANARPQISALSPVAGAVNVATAATFSLTFDDWVYTSSEATLLIKNYDTDELVETIDIAELDSESGLLEFSATDLPESKHLYIVAGAQNIISSSSNSEKFIGLTEKSDWDFTTADETAPAVVSFSPVDDAVGVSTNGVFTATFDEPIFLEEGTGQAVAVARDANSLFYHIFNLDDPRLSIDGNTLTISLGQDLLEGRDYWIWIKPGVVKDASDNYYNSHNYTNSWNFTTIDETAPSIVTLSPANNATGIAIQPDLVLTFQKNITLNTSANGYFAIRRASDGGLSQAGYSFSSSSVNVENGNQVRIVLDYPLAENTEYYVQSYSDDDILVSDDSGNTHSTWDHDKTVWSFTTADATAPEVTSFDPEVGSTEVSLIAHRYTLTFDEEVFSTGGGSFRFYDKSTDEPVSVNAYFPPFSTFDGNSVTIYYPFNLPVATEVYILISNAIEDASGNKYDIQTSDTWYFTTELNPEQVAPTVVGLSPANGSIGAAADANLVITFSEAVKKPTIPKEIVVRRKSGALVEQFVIGSPSITINENVATIDLTNDLEENEEYTVQISQGAFLDLYGNVFAGIAASEWGFRAFDTIAPEVVSLSPADEATDVPFDGDLVVTFNEPIAAGNANIRVRTLSGTIVFGGRPEFETEMFSIDGSTLTIHLSEASYTPMTNGKDYYVEILNGAVKDLSGNLFAGQFTDIETWNFHTGYATGTQPPQIVNASPANGATGVALDQDIVLTFDKPIVAGQTYFRLRTKDGDSPKLGGRPQFETDLFSVEGNDLTVHLSYWQASTTHDANLLRNGLEYYATLDFGAVLDMAGNSFEGASENDLWSFTMVPPVEPITFSPMHEAADVSVDVGTLVMTFDEPMVPGVGTFRLRLNPGNQVIQEFDMGTDEVTFSGNTISLNNVIELSPGVSYWVQNFNQFDDDVAKDQDGNYLKLWNNPDTWNFTTAKLDQTITIESISDKLITDEPFSVVASTDSDLALTYEVSGPATISGTLITLTGETGVVTVTVLQAGNSTYKSASEQITFNVTDPSKTDQTITFDEITDKVFGDTAFELIASASSALPVTFSVVSGPVTLDGNLVTITGAGTAIIGANQAGDATFNAAPRVTHTFNIDAANQTITFEAISDKAFGDAAFALTASASSELPVTFSVVSGSVTIADNLVTITGAGAVVIAANQGGNDNFYEADEQTQSFNIAKANQTIEIEPISDKLITDAAFTVSATVDTGLPLTYAVSGPATNEGSLVTLSGESGQVTVTVSHDGNDNYEGASSTTTFQVTDPSKTNQTITFSTIEDMTYTDAPFTLDASASSGLAVTYTVVSGPVTIAGNEVTITGTGEATIAANQSGDGTFNPALQVTQIFTISKADQAITITAIADKLTTDAPFDVVATTTSNLDLSYAVTGAATIVGTTITVTGEGTVTVTVTQSGDDNFHAAEATTTFDVSEEEEEEPTLSVADQITLSIYPNPATDYVKIEGLQSAKAALVLYDLGGIKVKEQEVADGDILSLRELEVGMYIVKITDQNITTTTRLLIR